MENPVALTHARDFKRLNAGVEAAVEELRKRHGFKNFPGNIVEDMVWDVLCVFHQTIRDYKDE